MSEASVRELLRDAMTGDEPPVSQHLLGSAVRAARRTRRLRWITAVSAAAATMPALAFGVPAVAGALGQAAIGHHGAEIGPGSGHGGQRPVSHPKHISYAATPGRRQFMRPEPPPAYADTDPVPITSQSIGQLLIDDPPAGAQMSQIQATVRPLPNSAPVRWRTVYAYFNNVRTQTGAGLVQASMMQAGASPFDAGCQGESAAVCRDYRLPGGVRVVEDHSNGMFNVVVFRPHMVEFDVSEANYAAAAGSPVTRGMPLTLAQMLKVAMDPRWQFTISQSFAQRASGLKVAPLARS